MVGGARKSHAPILFQVVNVDPGDITFVHAPELMQILNS